MYISYISRISHIISAVIEIFSSHVRYTKSLTLYHRRASSVELLYSYHLHITLRSITIIALLCLRSFNSKCHSELPILHFTIQKRSCNEMQGASQSILCSYHIVVQLLRQWFYVVLILDKECWMSFHLEVLLSILWKPDEPTRLP